MTLDNKIMGVLAAATIAAAVTIHHDLNHLTEYMDDFQIFAEAHDAYALVSNGVRTDPNIYQDKALILADLHMQEKLKDTRESWDGLDTMFVLPIPWDSEPHYQIYTGL